ncbi:MAG: rhodanese-like domain-containing protein [Ketobacteraceae bacterium]|nr:rhodanese-like domain-containing protein [Ketobacteraceae bacterium]
MKYREIQASEAESILGADGALVLDLRDNISYREGHIEGAMLAHDALTESIIKRKEYDRPIMVYCYHGNSSKEFAEFISALGFRNVYNLAGGFTAWKKQLASE